MDLTKNLNVVFDATCDVPSGVDNVGFNIDRAALDVLMQYSGSADSLLEATAVTGDTDATPLVPLLRYTDGESDYPCDLLCRGTLLMINGQKGARKSTLIRALCLTLLNGNLSGSLSPYTLTALYPGLRVAVIDTEQHKSRVARSDQWLRNRYKGREDYSDRMFYYAARGLDTQAMGDLLVTICEKKRPDVVVMDVISHAVDDINDQRASKIAVDMFNAILTKYGVALIGVIHQNPSTQATAADKMAGAMGTKLLQAAEAVLNIARVPDGTPCMWDCPTWKEESKEADEKNEYLATLWRRGSVVSIVEYRDKWPLVRSFAVAHTDSGEIDIIPAMYKGDASRTRAAKDLSFKTPHAVEVRHAQHSKARSLTTIEWEAADGSK